MADKPMIQLKDVSKIYDNGTVGLKDINLTINKGEFVVVVGLSGAGKSTLLRSINRLHNISSGDTASQLLRQKVRTCVTCAVISE